MVQNSNKPGLKVRINSTADAFAKIEFKNGIEQIKIVSQHMFESQMFLHLLFLLPDETGIKAIGKKHYSREISANLYEHGVEFWDILEADKKRLLEQGLM